MKKRMLLITLCLLFVMTALCGCDVALPDEATLSSTETKCKAMLDALIMNDRDLGYALMSEDVSKADFNSFFRIIGPFLEGKGRYELSLYNVQQEKHQGISYTILTYEAKFADGPTYLVTCTVAEGQKGLAGVQVQENPVYDTPLGLRIAFFVGSLLMIAFTVWMVIDCIVRKPNGMGLWIVLMLFTVKLTFAASAGETAFEWSIGLFFSLSSMGIGGITSILILSLPVGTIVYFFLRKKLPCKKKATQAKDTARGTYTESAPKFPTEDHK